MRPAPLMAMCLLLVGCGKAPEDSFRELLEGWYSAIQTTTWSCDAMGQKLQLWEEKRGAELVALIPTIVERAQDADDTSEYLTELRVHPSAKAREGMNACIDHPIVKIELGRMAERLSSLYRLERDE